MNTTVHDIRALAVSRGVTIDDTARVQAMNAPDAVLKRVRLWAEHGLQSQLSDLVAAVAHIDAQADHITALRLELQAEKDRRYYDVHTLTAERDAAIRDIEIYKRRIERLERLHRDIIEFQTIAAGAQ
jgi:hypothetical protein